MEVQWENDRTKWWFVHCHVWLLESKPILMNVIKHPTQLGQTRMTPNWDSLSFTYIHIFTSLMKYMKYWGLSKTKHTLSTCLGVVFFYRIGVIVLVSKRWDETIQWVLFWLRGSMDLPTELWQFRVFQSGLSWNGGAPKWMVCHGNSSLNRWLGVPLFWEPSMCDNFCELSIVPHFRQAWDPVWTSSCFSSWFSSLPEISWDHDRNYQLPSNCHIYFTGGGEQPKHLILEISLLPLVSIWVGDCRWAAALLAGSITGSAARLAP